MLVRLLRLIGFMFSCAYRRRRRRVLVRVIVLLEMHGLMSVRRRVMFPFIRGRLLIWRMMRCRSGLLMLLSGALAIV